MSAFGVLAACSGGQAWPFPHLDISQVLMKNLFTDLPSSLQTGFGADNHSLWPQVREQVDKRRSAAPTVGEDPLLPDAADQRQGLEATFVPAGLLTSDG